MASVRPINVIIKGDYTDRDIKRAIKDLQSLQKQAPKTTKAVGGLSSEFKGLMAGAAAAFSIGAIANQMKDMAQAAAQDQKSVVALGRAMSNLGIGSQTSAMEDYVKATMLATGTSDELIRQGLTRLTTATGDAAEAQKLLNLALDISAAGYGDLVSISTALSKAATGNVTALKRLGVPLDENAVKAKDFGAIVDNLSTKFRGQASSAANTYAGQLQRLDTAIGEAQETIGYALLGALDDVSSAFGGTGGFIDSITESATQVGYLITGVGELSNLLLELGNRVDGEGATWVDWLRTAGDELANTVIPGYDGFKDAVEGVLMVGKASTLQEQERARLAQVVADRYTGYANALRGVVTQTDEAAEATDRQRSAVDRLKASLDKLNGRNRSIIGDRIALRRAKAEGPDSTGGKKGNVVTGDDRKVWGLDIAQQAESLANSLAAKGQFAKARKVLNSNRQFLASQIGEDFANNVLSTPAWLDRGNAGQRASGQRYQQGSGQVNNYYFNGDLLVRDAADAAEQAKRIARLKALGRGRVAEAARYAGMAS